MLDIEISIKRGGFARSVCIREAARVVALVGRSGAGKTTILQAIAGLLRPDSGRIDIDGRVLFDRDQRINIAPHRRRIGYVFQDARLFPHMDVQRNLLYGRHRRTALPGSDFDFDAVVELLGIGALLHRRPRTLSGGEAQRVAIGRALLSHPALLLLDEPLSALDEDRREELIPYLQRVRDEVHLPMLYVSHRSDEVARIADAVHTLA